MSEAKAIEAAREYSDGAAKHDPTGVDPENYGAIHVAPLLDIIERQREQKKLNRARAVVGALLEALESEVEDSLSTTLVDRKLQLVLGSGWRTEARTMGDLADD